MDVVLGILALIAIACVAGFRAFGSRIGEVAANTLLSTATDSEPESKPVGPKPEPKHRPTFLDHEKARLEARQILREHKRLDEIEARERRERLAKLEEQNQGYYYLPHGYIPPRITAAFTPRFD